MMLLFLLTRPLRDVTSLYRRSVTIHYISTHTPLTGRDIQIEADQKRASISTHTPLTGRDFNDFVEQTL